MNKLPRGWINVTFEDVVDVNPRKSVDLTFDDMVTFVPMAAVSEISGSITNGVVRPLREVNKGFTQFAENDVIFAKITPSMENGKSAVAIGLENGIGFGSTEFHVLRSRGAVLPEYIWCFIRQKSFREAAQKVMSGAVGQQRVPASYLKTHTLPLPPLNEQKRIISKIEKQNDHIIRAHYELDCIPALIEKYKESILRLVFEHVDGVDTTIDELAEFVTSGSRGWAKYYSNDGSLFLRVGNTKRGSIDLDLSDKQKLLHPSGTEGTRTRIQGGDILVTITADLGRVAVIPDDFEEAYVNQHISLVRLKSPLISRYLAWFLVSPEGQILLKKNNRGAIKAGLRLDDIRKIKIVLPEMEKQEQIVRCIEASFELLNRVMAEHAALNNLLPKLDAAIHKMAFRGQLVPQELSDEPVNISLSRIYSEKTTVTKEISQARRKKESIMKNPIENLLEDSKNWPDKGLLFEEIAKRNAIPYDTMRDIIFALLAEEKPRLKQIFDKETASMYLQRVKK